MGITIFVSNKKTKELNVDLEKIWNLSHGEEITPDMYENEKLEFTSNNGHKSFISIDKNSEGYVLVGESEDNQNREQGIIEYYNLDGKIQWTKRYPNIDANNYEVASRFDDVLAVEDGYIVIGFEDGDGPNFDDPSYSNAMIIKYDLNGNLLWNKKYNMLLSTGDLNNNLRYELVDVINLNGKYYIVGTLEEHIITETSLKLNKQYGLVIELDSNGNEISFNKYEEGSDFYSSKVIDNKIIINSLLGYKIVDTEENYYSSFEALGLLAFDGNSFEQIIKYVENSGEYKFLSDNYRNFEYMDGVYYLIDPSGKVLAIDKDGNTKFSIQADKDNQLKNYWFEDITTDGKNIYVYAYYYDMYESYEMTDSAIIVFDNDGKYKLIDIDEQNYYKILFKDDSLLLPGSENSFAKYKIKR